MLRKSSLVVLLFSLAVAGYIVAGAVLHNAEARRGDVPYKQFDVYREVLDRINEDYVTDPNLDKVTDGALHGLLDSLDPDSAYLNPQEYQDYKQHVHSGDGGIGVVVSKRSGFASVVDVVPGSPADKAQISRGDLIEQIAGRPVHEMSELQIADLIAGRPGTPIDLTVIHYRKGPDPVKLTLTRVVVPPPRMTAQLLANQIGYVKLPDLDPGRAQQLAAHVRALQGQGAQKLVLDLRDCASGDYTEAERAANDFLDHGVITYLEGQTYPRVTTMAQPQKHMVRLPVAVLVNAGTAGPAEVLTAALLDNARADVVGTRTWGDASLPKVVEVGDGSALLLSVARYFTPDGKPIEEKGVKPNVIQVENPGAMPDDDYPLMGAPATHQDLQLDRAENLLTSGHQPASPAAANSVVVAQPVGG
jgi:carboxyl-terminal processing protease